MESKTKRKVSEICKEVRCNVGGEELGKLPFSRLIGVSDSLVSTIESGASDNPSPLVLARIFRNYGFDRDLDPSLDDDEYDKRLSEKLNEFDLEILKKSENEKNNYKKKLAVYLKNLPKGLETHNLIDFFINYIKNDDEKAKIKAYDKSDESAVPYANHIIKDKYDIDCYIKGSSFKHHFGIVLRSRNHIRSGVDRKAVDDEIFDIFKYIIKSHGMTKDLDDDYPSIYLYLLTSDKKVYDYLTDKDNRFDYLGFRVFAFYYKFDFATYKDDKPECKQLNRYDGLPKAYDGILFRQENTQ